MKIQLQSLRVVNCGPLRDVCIHFNTKGESPVTVLAGANGSGKTTTLKLIIELAKTLLPTFNPVDEADLLKRADYAQMDCLVDGEPLDVFYGHIQHDEFHPNYYGTSVAVRNGAKGFTKGRKTKQFHGHLVNDIQDALKEQQGQVLNAVDVKVTADNDKKIVPSFLYFPYERSILPIRERTQLHREETTYQWIYQYQNTSSFRGSLDSYLIWLDYAEPEIYAEVIDFLNGLDFDGKKFGVQRKELRAIVTTRDGQTHGVAELSSGEQNILIMLLELRRRLLPYSIVLIDEIENSLHPAFQHRLAQGLLKLQKQTPFQLIFTTHSTELVDVFGPSSVRILTEF